MVLFLFLDSTSTLVPIEYNFSDLKYESDPYLFKDVVLNTELVRKLVSIGSCQPGLNDDYTLFPTIDNRRFQINWYKLDGKIRSWLIYSPRANCLFCQYCWLLSDSNKTVWADARRGFKNFKKGPEKIKQHEESDLHRSLTNKFLVMKLRLLQDSSVLQEQIKMEKSEIMKNREALKRLIDIILYLAKQCLPLRGHDESETSKNKGNFLELVDLLRKYDGILAGHLANASKVSKYTSGLIQNELLDHLSRRVLDSIINNIKQAKYFSIIVDSTLDYNKKEQLSLSCRFVNKLGVPEERFLRFINIPDGSAQTYFVTVTEELKNLNVDIKFCRGQGYDGASVMSGCLNGLQSKIKDIVPEAVYIHCCAHNLNLVLIDAVSSNSEVKLFFGILEKVYVFFYRKLSPNKSL